MAYPATSPCSASSRTFALLGPVTRTQSSQSFILCVHRRLKRARLASVTRPPPAVPAYARSTAKSSHAGLHLHLFKSKTADSKCSQLGVA